MKIQIIRLEKHDDVLSARDKLSWTAGDRVLLVWPRIGRILTTHLDMLLIQRQSERLGTQLAVVTKDRRILQNAASLGVKTFRSVEQARQATWTDKKPGKTFTIKHKDHGNLRATRPERNLGVSSINKIPVLRFFLFGLAICSIISLVFFIIISAWL